jgi:hypothetical protein
MMGSTSDVVLVIGRDKRLAGIVTAWDLADEFQKLIGPFKWIGEIESRLRKCLFSHLNKEAVHSFLASSNSSVDEPNPEFLTLGDLLHLVRNPEVWEQLSLPFDRATFAEALDDVREMRNRLMHFRDPLAPDEATRLRSFCRMIRKVP